jgi:peroxiredoxin
VKDARATWRKAVLRSFPVLSARGSDVLHSYGLLQAGGDDGKSDDIAIRTTLLIDENGREIWRYVSETANDFPRATWVLARLQQNNH